MEAIPTMRSAYAAAKILREADPNCKISYVSIKRWAEQGKFATVKIGKHVLCNMESLYAFLRGESQME